MKKKIFLILILTVFTIAYGCSSTKEIELRVQEHPSHVSAPGIIAPPVSVKEVGSTGSVGYKTSISFWGNTIVACSRNGTVFTLNPSSGTVKEILNIGEPIQATCLFHGGYIYIGTIKGTLAKITTNGKIIWKKKLEYPVVGTLETCNKNLYVTTENNGIYCVDPQNGNLKWHFSKPYNTLSIRGAAAVLCYNNSVFVGFNDGTIAKIQNGNEVWETSISSKTMFSDVDSKLQLFNGNLYSISTSGKMACINPVTGDIVWQKPISGYSNIAKTFFALFVADNNGTIYAVDPTGGDIIWSEKLSNRYNIYSIYATRDGSVVYAMLGNGTLVAMNAMNGKIMDIQHINTDITSPLIRHGDSLYTISRRGTIYSITPRYAK